MAHILLVLRPAVERPSGDLSLSGLVERTLLSIQAPGAGQGVVTFARGCLALGVLGPGYADSGTRTPAYRLVSSLDEANGGARLELPGISIDATPALVHATSDSVASRTLWFCGTDEQFLLSTSQRALIRWLGDYQPADATAGWFMVTGSAGPGQSWDRRIKALPPGAMLSARAGARAPTVSLHDLRFAPRPGSAGEQRGRMLDALRLVARDMPSGPGVTLSLSGGLDSRVLLQLATTPSALPCVTWGSPGALELAGTDAAVARDVARHFKAPFRFLPLVQTDLSRALDNYVAASEGRLDHVGGYLDGMAIWQTLAAKDDVGILLRGDEAFGWLPVMTPADVRRSVGAPELSDFGNAAALRLAGLGELELPRLPAPLDRAQGETLAAWRDRLYHGFRIPTVLAALTNTKAGYLETFNPLLDERILSVVRGLPDPSRTGKRLFRDVARCLQGFPTRLPLATIESGARINWADLTRIALAEIDAPEATVFLPPRLREFLRAEARSRTASVHPQKAGRTATLRSISNRLRLPIFLRRLARNTIAREQLPIAQLLLRAVLLSRTVRQLRADAHSNAELVGVLAAPASSNAARTQP